MFHTSAASPDTAGTAVSVIIAACPAVVSVKPASAAASAATVRVSSTCPISAQDTLVINMKETVQVEQSLDKLMLQERLFMQILHK